MTFMKRIIALSLLCIVTLALLPLSLAACGNGKNKDNGKIIEITATTEAIAYRDAMFETTGALGTTREQQLAAWDASLEQLSAVYHNGLPAGADAYDLVKEPCEYGDLYSLTPDDGTYDCIVLYIHGGAWVYEIDALHVAFCDALRDELHAKVYIPLYPLAPQYNYTDTYQMMDAVYTSLLEQDKPIYIMGDSAGGTITLGFVLNLKLDGKKLPDKVVAMAPCADLSFTNTEIDTYAQRDGMLQKYLCASAAAVWADGADLTNPAVSPLYGDFAGFPDTMLFVGDCDILCPDDLKLYDKMVQAGVNVTQIMGRGLWHVYPIFNIPEAQQCMDFIVDFCKG